jgi:nitrilase
MTSHAAKTKSLKVAVAQIAPVWLDRQATVTKVVDYIKQAAQQKVELLAFGEGLVPGYPFWLSTTGGSEFNSEKQKNIFAHYAEQAVQIEAGHLTEVCHACEQGNISIYLGIIERPQDRASHSLYCSFVYIDQQGIVQSVHRKLMPTFEERLAWAPGDGNGLRVHRLGDFTVGGLNCWENWMPLARSSLYAQGEDLHIACWPGSQSNTQDISQFMAKEGRSFVVSASSLMRPSDISAQTPEFDMIKSALEQVVNKQGYVTDGGSCICGPNGQWIVEPKVNFEGLIVVEIEHSEVYKERQNFDPMGHYSRADVTKLSVNRKRQSCVEWQDEST